MNRSQMRNRIKAITNGFRKKAEPVQEELTEEVERARALVVKLKKANKGLADAELFEELTGYPVVQEFERDRDRPSSRILKFFKPLVAVVPLSVYGNNDYPLNRPIVLFNDDVAIKNDGQIGGVLRVANLNETNHIRLATDAEIEQLTDAQLDRMIEEYTG